MRGKHLLPQKDRRGYPASGLPRALFSRVFMEQSHEGRRVHSRTNVWPTNNIYWENRKVGIRWDHMVNQSGYKYGHPGHSP